MIKTKQKKDGHNLTEFRITPVNSGYYTLQIYPRVYVNMFRVKLRATLGLIFFTDLIKNSDKQWKVLSGCLKKLPSGIPSGHHTLGSSLGQLFPDNHCGLSTVYTILKVRGLMLMVIGHINQKIYEILS